jgi:hypothetical protein
MAYFNNRSTVTVTIVPGEIRVYKVLSSTKNNNRPCYRTSPIRECDGGSILEWYGLSAEFGNVSLVEELDIVNSRLYSMLVVDDGGWQARYAMSC